jgi:hypothetical protein
LNKYPGIKIVFDYKTHDFKATFIVFKTKKILISAPTKKDIILSKKYFMEKLNQYTNKENLFSIHNQYNSNEIENVDIYDLL